MILSVRVSIRNHLSCCSQWTYRHDFTLHVYYIQFGQYTHPMGSGRRPWAAGELSIVSSDCAKQLRGIIMCERCFMFPYSLFDSEISHQLLRVHWNLKTNMEMVYSQK